MPFKQLNIVPSGIEVCISFLLRLGRQFFPGVRRGEYISPFPLSRCATAVPSRHCRRTVSLGVSAGGD